MPRGMSIHLSVSEGTTRCHCALETLTGADNDAWAMSEIARVNGFDVRLMPPGTATKESLVRAIRAASESLTEGDILLLTFSGHGCRIYEMSEDGEVDGRDEVWCLEDDQILDNDLYALWAEFKPGVRIVVVSDSCHSESMLLRLHDGRLKRVSLEEARSWPTESTSATGACQQEIRRVPAKEGQAGIVANVLLLAACGEYQLAQDGEQHGLFTEKLLEVWGTGYDGSYIDLMREVCRKVSIMNPEQHPVLRCAGTGNPSLANERPFTI